ncbi:MAG: type II toxin-antitoxin system RelE/ParE family toxin [Deltaproteobacteria bacterium]|nr:type II toxin-antitoxin system RelE/ParE family toxin [Deltaproteobacteria bacterium]
MKITFHDAIAQDLDDILTYLYEERPGWDEFFSAEFETLLDKIEHSPWIGKHAEESLPENCRRVFLRRFPYSLVYRVGRDEIVVVSIHHMARNDLHWRSRLQNEK